MGKAHIKLYVDVISPFAYMGYWFVRNSPIFKSVDVEYVPILLGGLFKTTGGLAPLAVKNKDKWIERERLTWAKKFSIPMREERPQGFPIPTIAAQRLLTAIHLKSPTLLSQALDTLYTAMWSPSALPASTPRPTNGPDYAMNDPADLHLLLAPVLGESTIADLIRATTTPEIKQGLSRNTEAAFRDGAFGLPWFLCTNEKGETTGFWGFDHLGLVVEFLGLGEVPGASGKMRPLL